MVSVANRLIHEQQDPILNYYQRRSYSQEGYEIPNFISQQQTKQKKTVMKHVDSRTSASRWNIKAATSKKKQLIVYHLSLGYFKAAISDTTHLKHSKHISHPERSYNKDI